MHIYLKHNKHGTKIAISDMEAKQDELNGWVRYNPDHELTEEKPVNELEIKRRGRPPKATE